jgi:hypothetical protein
MILKKAMVGWMFGLSKMKLMYCDVSTEDLGKPKITSIKELFFDFMYAPIVLTYSEITSQNPQPDVSPFEINNFGFRIGGNRRLSFFYSKRMAHHFGYQLLFRPGLSGNTFDISAFYAIVILGKAKTP